MRERGCGEEENQLDVKGVRSGRRWCNGLRRPQHSRIHERYEIVMGLVFGKRIEIVGPGTDTIELEKGFVAGIPFPCIKLRSCCGERNCSSVRMSLSLASSKNKAFPSHNLWGTGSASYSSSAVVCRSRFTRPFYWATNLSMTSFLCRDHSKDSSHLPSQTMLSCRKTLWHTSD